jgi:hypothetical protein
MAGFLGHETLRRTNTPSPEAISAEVPQTYGRFCGQSRQWGHKIWRLAAFSLPFLGFSQSVRAQVTQPIDLRIEIDEEIYSSLLCQKLVRLHEDSEFAPWGMVFSRPSHFCSFPLKISKGYNLSMWRLVVSAGENHVSFVVCRPTRPADIRNERCDWRVDIKRPANLSALLKSDRFLLEVMAALHEKLPVREYAQLGQTRSRPEPRIKSVVLENPPKLVHSTLHFSQDGRATIDTKPVSVFHSSTPEDAVWLIPAEPIQQRLVMMETYLREAGYEPISPPAVVKTADTKSVMANPVKPTLVDTPPEGAKSQNPSSADTKPPLPVAKKVMPANNPVIQTSEKPLSEPERRRPLKASELPPQKPSPSRAQPKIKVNPQYDRNQPSVFARDELTPPDDSEVVTLKGAQDFEETLPKANFFERLWDVLWPGLWKTQFEWSGLPVPESERSRLPATQTAAMSGWHPIWRELSAGASVRRTTENEIVDLKISLPDAALFQQAMGRRTTTLVSGLLQAEMSVQDYKAQATLNSGLVYLDETWNYDRKKSTFELWSPSGRGTFFEPSLSFYPNTNFDGTFTRISYTSYKFENTKGWRWNIDTGWQWTITDDWAQWKKVRLSALQGFVGVQRGLLSNTDTRLSGQENNEIPLNALNLGLRIGLDETY